MILDFSAEQFCIFILGFLLLTISAISFEWDKKRASILLLLIGTFILGYFIAILDPFLVVWDEQYHALVAKNLSENFLKPTLYKIPVLDYDYRDWSNNYIWLHKQPLFLWQMALSIKFFGANEFSIRLPSIIMHAILPLFIYRIGKITVNQRAGFYGALFFSVAYFPLELVAGKFATDHNDIAFLFYVSASFWAWFEYQHSQNKYCLILIGLFSGCAVLVKWLIGLLIYIVWLTGIFVDKNLREKAQPYLSLLKSLSITLILFIPWQLYVNHVYPLESADVFSDNLKHFIKPVDEHGGTIWFHLMALKDMYGHGDAVPFLILAGLVVLYKKIDSAPFRIAIFGSIGFIYLFYSLAATKMISYCLIVSPFVFIALGSLFEYLLSIIKIKIQRSNLTRIFSLISLIIICFFLFDLEQVRHYHTMWKPNDNLGREKNLTEMKIIKKLPSILQNKKYVLFNPAFSLNGHIPIMFYTDYIAYNYIPSREQLKIVYSKGYEVAIFNIGTLPDYILQNDSIIKINMK